MNLNVLLGVKGASWTLAGACASGAHAVGQAADLIALGRQDRILCGGVQELNWESVSSFDATNAFSMRTDDPEAASRPFDSGRDGLVPSGGAAVLALERGDLARKRGARILGHLRSYAFSSDGHSLVVPSGEGLRRCMEECLKRGEKPASEVDFVCAHATSTPLGDRAEAGAIAGVFASSRPLVASLKSMTGHEMWMAGASQVAYTLLMMRGGFLAASRNFERQEPEAAPINIIAKMMDHGPRLALLNAAGFGGTNACLLLESGF
jgi:3-oxoacyl-[acyl-carrier-protein] synthase-1